MTALPPSIIEMLKERKLATSEAQYFMQHNEIASCDDKDGIAVIMVVFHTGRVLFDSIGRVLSDPCVKQFIIIDNGSSEKVEQRLNELKEEHDHVLLIQGQGNIGFAKGANLGAHLATQPWLVFLNPDALLQPDCARKLVMAAITQKKLTPDGPCIVGARLLNPDLTEQRGARRGEVTPFTTLVSLLQLHRYVPAWRKYEIHQEDQPLPAAPMSVPTISGACFAVSRSDFSRLKGFDSKFFLHVEDVDLCWRTRDMGGAVLFHPDAEVVHEGHTSRVEPVFVERNKGNGLIYYFNKRARGKGFWRMAYVRLLGPLIIATSIGRSLFRPRMKEDEE